MGARRSLSGSPQFCSLSSNWQIHRGDQTLPSPDEERDDQTECRPDEEGPVNKGDGRIFEQRRAVERRIGLFAAKQPTQMGMPEPFCSTDAGNRRGGAGFMRRWR